MGRFELRSVNTRKTTTELADALVQEGYTIESLSLREAKTKPVILLGRRGRKELEFNLWFGISDGLVRVYCTQRVLPVWRFRECSDVTILTLISYEMDVIRGLK